VAAAEALDGPVVLKVASPDLLHKSDLGLVEVGINSATGVRRAYANLLERALSADRMARIEGVLVSEMITGGTETVVGVAHDALFGPVVMFGLGGVFVEVLGDVTFRVPPFDKDEAARMIDEVEGRALLDGVRGRAKSDRTALVDTIMKVQRLAVDLHDDIAELDINPLVVLPKGAVALDALVVCR
jgi:acyl-CoA synthetase (NDP forming)